MQTATQENFKRNTPADPVRYRTISPLEKMHSDFVEFVSEKLKALGMSQRQLALEVYSDDNFKAMRKLFEQKPYSKLTAAEKMLYRKHKEKEKLFLSKRSDINRILNGYNKNIQIELMAKILHVLKSEIQFKEN